MPMRTAFSRNSRGWAQNSAAEYIEIPVDTLKLDHDPVTAARLGLLIEGQATTLDRPEIDLSQPDAGANVVELTKDGVNYTEVPDGRKRTISFQATWVADSENVIMAEIESPGRQLSIAVEISSGVNIGVVFDADGVVEVFENEYFLNVRAGTYKYGNRIRLWLSFYLEPTAPLSRNTLELRFYNNGNFIYSNGNELKTIKIHRLQHTHASAPTSIIPTLGTTRAADFFDAPGSLNADTYGPGLHTWRNAVRMSHDPGEPTIIGSAEHRIYASNGRLHLDGPGELIQPEGEHAPGDYVPFIWNVRFPGAAPDFTLGREYGDTNWWNGHLVDIVPFPRKLTAAEINAWVGA